MSEKMLAVWAAVFLALISPGQAQYDPLASDIFALPGEKGTTSSLNAQKVYIDPNADPLGIDALMQPIDPEHSTEYLNKIGGRTYLGPFVPAAQDLRGNWHLLLQGGVPGETQLFLVQNRDAVFGRGNLYLAGSTSSVSASGQAVKDVLYLDLINAETLVLYRCTLTMSKDFLSGSFAAFDAYGQAWSGTIQGSRSA
ncbi:MAG: hypothetical protein A4E49_02913 [Methanosaeta sp. PtaU1.Bin112]|nr:MAG: hypothetical protein A4E49_02913 [Methanosaeta sp. PtaU1.Bin112]